MDEKCFIYAFRSSKSLDKDCYAIASAKRKTLSLFLHESIRLKEDNAVSEVLLNEGLNEYAQIVDCEGANRVNNYADHIRSIESNYQNDERKNWKSQLKNFDIEKHLQPLTCSNGINCENLTSDNFNSLKPAFQQYTEPDQNSNEKLISANSEGSFSRNLTKSFTAPVQKANQNFQNQPVDGSKNKDNLFFRTARDELLIQQANKKNNSSNKFNQNPVKKYLGTRKGNVYGKFQPPVRSSETAETEPSSSIKLNGDEAIDERLKNIDAEMIEKIKNEIMDCGSKITWDDIAGLHLAKSTIQEIVVWPMLRPDIFTGLRRPPKGILLFGPPGTGKTLIGKCIASQSNSTFFSISASSLTSKWVGEGEKMVRTLFAVAKVYQPSVVFVDEIDSLLMKRNDSDHETSRRLKTEFLVQLDGAGTGDEDKILIIGATNRPQELDDAARRRLVKRLYIPLPDEEARKQIIKNLISKERHCLLESEIENIAKLTDGYSGADVKNLCQEASLGPVRSIPPSMIHNIHPEDVRPLNVKDFEAGLCKIKSSVSPKDIEIYSAWDKQYGCGSVHK